MNVLSILRDAWFFYSRNLLSIARLCLPLILLESLARLAIDHLFGKGDLDHDPQPRQHEQRGAEHDQQGA